MHHKYKRRPLLVLLPLCFVFLLHPETVDACSCGLKPTVLDTYEQADVVLIARAISLAKVNEKSQELEERYHSDGIRSVSMVIEKVFKGNLKVHDEISVGQGNGIDCYWTFYEKSVGEEYLLYLQRPTKQWKLWYVWGCVRSNALSRASDDLLYLNNMDKVRGKTRISGTYGGAEDSDDVTGKKIRIIGQKKTYETKTDQQGVYELYGLPPGKYLLEPEMPAGWKIDRESSELTRSPSYSKKAAGTSKKRVAFTLEPKKHAGIDLSFAIDNVVSGSVHDPTGKPMYEVCAVLVPTDAKNGHERIGGLEYTDKKGRFEITSVAPGSYVLVLNEDGTRSSKEPFGPLYYPNVTEREKAAVITIAAGQSVKDLNIVVPAVDDTITVEGVLLYSDDKPVANEWVEFKATKLPGIDGDVTTKTDAEGRFSIKILKGLNGELDSDFSASSDEFEKCRKLPRTTGRAYTLIKTPANRIEAEHNLYNVVLKFPFPPASRRSRGRACGAGGSIKPRA